jgi:hypothetical protein
MLGAYGAPRILQQYWWNIKWYNHLGKLLGIFF